MKKELAFEIRREALHVSVGIAIILLVMFCNYALWLLFFALVLGIILSLALLKFKIPLISRLLPLFERKKHMKKFPGKGMLFFVAGCLLALKLFSRDIALASIAILAFGDSVSHLFFVSEKKYFLKKSFKSIIAGITASFLPALFFVPLIYALASSVIAMIAEAIYIKLGEAEVDDNLIVPLVAGTVMHLLSKFA